MASSPTSEFKSALQENIEKKGSNAYYHAWKKDARNNDPNAVPLKVGDEVAQVAKVYSTISSYSYADSAPKISVYVPLVNVETIDKANIVLSCQSNSFELTVSELDGKDHRLHIHNLFDEINTETSKFLVKPGKLIVILKKLTEKEWSDLRKKD